MARIIIVDEKDNQIGLKERGTLKKEDIYRVSALWIVNSKGDILLAKRALTKDHHPGMWGPAAAGTVEEKETYESNIIKEAKEELGLKNIKLQKGPKKRAAGEYDHFCQWYILTIDKEIDKFKLQKAEVDEIKWFKKEELISEIKKNPSKFLPTMKRWAKLLLPSSKPLNSMPDCKICGNRSAC